MLCLISKVILNFNERSEVQRLVSIAHLLHSCLVSTTLHLRQADMFQTNLQQVLLQMYLLCKEDHQLVPQRFPTKTHLFIVPPILYSLLSFDTN